MPARWFPLACLGALACKAAEPAAAVIDTLPSGQITVTNLAPSGWADTTGWKIVKVSERTFKFGELGSMERPNFPAAFPDGGMVVVNQRPVFISRFSPALEPLGQFSRDGEGPGEFRGPELFVARDSIYVVDNARSVLAAFDPEGKLGRETPLPCCVNEIGVVDTAGRFAIGGPFVNPHTAIRWWSLDASRFVDSVTLPEGPKGMTVESCSFGLPYQPERLAAAGRNGLTWWGVSDADRFVLTRHGTDTLLVTSTDRPRVPVTEAELGRVFDDTTFFAKQCGAALTSRRGDVPKMKPAFNGLMVDDQDNLWVQRSGVPKGHFDVYAPDGRWLGTVANPFSKEENWWWRGDHIGSVETRDDGAFVLRLYRIDRPGVR
jgi:hypothetical protein